MRAPALFCGAFAVTALAFLLAPQIDIAASALFYDPQHGFFLGGSLPVRLVAGMVPWVTGAIIAIIVAGSASLALFGRRLWRLDASALVFIALATALGPGILTNTVLKDHWGRARPAQIEMFGGPAEFTPAPLISEQCTRNCSFVSGHAALGFSVIGFAFLVPAGRRRRAAIAAALGFGSLVGLARIAGGRHFLSDVVDAGFLVTTTSWLLYRAIVVPDLIGRAQRSAGGRIALCAAALAAIEAALIVWVDRPLALYLHRVGGALQPVFVPLGDLGLGYPYLVLFAALFAVLRWGGEWTPLRARAPELRAGAAIPVFLFAAVAMSGLIADLLKVAIGRTRPKLLFLSGEYAFTWFGLRADHWSFPSGHVTTAAALMTALWLLWPRGAPLYVLFMVLVAASRIITGEHYLSDAVMGVVIGVASVRGLAVLFARSGYELPRRSARPV